MASSAPLLSEASLAPLPMLGGSRQRGAYAVIADPIGRVLIVEAVNGRCYLPGGRIEAGETARQALVREIAEECGWSAVVGRQVYRNVQPILNNQVSLEASFWRARLLEPLGSPAEHRLLWLDLAGATARVHRAGDIAALRLAAAELGAGGMVPRDGFEPPTP